jgi:two-component sensor histidine kinase
VNFDLRKTECFGRKRSVHAGLRQYVGGVVQLVPMLSINTICTFLKLVQGAAVESGYPSFSRRKPLRIPKRLPPKISLCLFRVTQEALQNAIKHSGSRNFEVRLDSALNEIHLSVRDPGTGFDLDEAMRGQGIGLTGMRERLKLVGGEFSIEVQLQHGTTIHARVPLSPRMMSAAAGE